METQTEMLYNFNNITYSVCALDDVHEKLQKDLEFFNQYFVENLASSEAVGVTEQENIDPTETTFNWTKQTTKLLLEKYNERKLRFRDPKVKKKLLWGEIVNAFKTKNYDVTEEILDRKMRNLKKSYRNIVDNNKKTTTGRGRINWEWYDNMEDIFREDRTIHIGPTLSSMAMAPNNADNREISSLVVPSTSNEQHASSCAHNNADNEVSGFVNPSAYNVQYALSSNYSEIEEVEQLEENRQLQRRELVSDSSASTLGNDLSEPNTRTKKQKAVKSKAMYDLRKKLLDCEEKRVEAINKLTVAIEEQNTIQRERNNILQELLSSNIRH